MEEKVLLDKDELVRYIICKYKESKPELAEISPIKLQKSLYFLFAKWGGRVLSVKENNHRDTEDDDIYGLFHQYLFSAQFEAWKFGPVDREVWTKYKNHKIDETPIQVLDFNTDNDIERITAKQYIDELLERIFITSDFGLVDLSHEDKCWQIAYKSKDPTMNNDTIIKEYAERM